VQYFSSMLSVPHMHRTILYNQIISICSVVLSFRQPIWHWGIFKTQAIVTAKVVD
jgi:hypothetical protein